MILFVVGVLDIMVDVNGTTIIQTGTPEKLLGRVFGAFEGVLILAMLVGALIVGPLIELLGARATTVVFAVAGLLIFLTCLPRLRKWRACSVCGCSSARCRCYQDSPTPCSKTSSRG